jgi:hypothetical protein
MAPQTPAEKQAQWLGEMNESISNIKEDIRELKAEQQRQGEVQVKQGNEITQLRTQMKTQVALASFFGGMIGSLVIGLILVFAQKGSP